MRDVTVGLIQMSLKGSTDDPPERIRSAMLDAYLPLIGKAADRGVKVLSFQELFNLPFFCASHDRKWFSAAERIPDGPTITLIRELARQYAMVIVAPIYEIASNGTHFNSAAVIDADGRHLGTYRKIHIPEVTCSEKLFFEAGSELPVFETAYCKLGVYICYDRHFPEGWRVLALKGAEYIINPSSTPSSPWAWKIEQPAAAIANSVYVGAINRVGIESPWNIGRFYGSSYVVNPRGEILASAHDDGDELVVADIDLALLREVREEFRFLRERRPTLYEPLVLDREELSRLKSVRGVTL